MKQYIISFECSGHITFLGFYEGKTAQEASKDALHTIEDCYKPGAIEAGKLTCSLISGETTVFIQAELKIRD